MIFVAKPLQRGPHTHISLEADLVPIYHLISCLKVPRSWTSLGAVYTGSAGVEDTAVRNDSVGDIMPALLGDAGGSEEQVTSLNAKP